MTNVRNPQAQGVTSLGSSCAGSCRTQGEYSLGLRFVGALLIAVVTLQGTVQSAEFRPTAQDKFVPAVTKFEILWDQGEFTEGPAAAPDGAILFSDIGNRIMRFDPKSNKTTVYREPSGKANGLIFDRQGQLIACEGANGGTRRLTLTTTAGEVQTLADRYDGHRFNSPNDVTVDKAGRIYFSDPRYLGNEPVELDFAGVFVVEPGKPVRLATRDVSMPNGLAASPDGKTLYAADNSPKSDGNHHLLAFAIGADGTLNDKRVLFDFGPNFRGIDGMTVDAKGNIFSTAGRNERSGVYVFGPAGEPLALIPTPGSPTNCEFGRGEDAHWLYVTSALTHEAPNQPPGHYGLLRIRLANSAP